jgi:hypothetical protein
MKSCSRLPLPGSIEVAFLKMLHFMEEHASGFFMGLNVSLIQSKSLSKADLQT